MAAKDMSVALIASNQTESERQPPFRLEPFVDADSVSSFLSVPRSDVLRMTREGKIRGYAYKGRSRHVYRYRLSEVSEDFSALACKPKATISQAALAGQRRKSNG
jgi:hypothetical protein